MRKKLIVIGGPNGNRNMKQLKFGNSELISAKTLREMVDLKKIANKAIQLAIEENRKAGISEDSLYSK